ncbi:pentalenene synthase [Kitasatospora sp. NPDC093806]|uniref:terpene synthase family protein n=1 Tax=Kitasatospora sp. NPDC093806 TaxID=3155075 RepID=UPI003419E070
MAATERRLPGGLFDSRGEVMTRWPAWDERTHPQDVEFGCPWPVRGINPRVAVLRERSVAWMHDFGLAEDRRVNADRYTDWLLAESAGWWFPQAPTERLQVVSDYIGWAFTPVDDVFDGPVGRDLAAATDLCRAMTAVLDAPDAPVPAGAAPRVHAFADLWRRLRRGRSRWWVRRSTAHWHAFFAAQACEIANRVNGRTSTLRQLTVIKCAYPIFDMSEAVSDFELPSLVWYSPWLTEFRTCLAEIITLNNDLVSSGKEARAGDHRNNLLLIAEGGGRARPDAFAHLAAMVHRRGERAVALEEQISDFDVLLTDAERRAVRRYVRHLQDIVAGDNRWERLSGRYR